MNNFILAERKTLPTGSLILACHSKFSRRFADCAAIVRHLSTDNQITTNQVWHNWQTNLLIKQARGKYVFIKILRATTGQRTGFVVAQRTNLTKSHTVNEHAMICSCGLWQATGMPCWHVVFGLRRLGEDDTRGIALFRRVKLLLDELQRVPTAISVFNPKLTTIKTNILPAIPATPTGRPKRGRKPTQRARSWLEKCNKSLNAKKPRV